MTRKSMMVDVARRGRVLKSPVVDVLFTFGRVGINVNKTTGAHR